MALCKIAWGWQILEMLLTIMMVVSKYIVTPDEYILQQFVSSAYEESVIKKLKLWLKE